MEDVIKKQGIAFLAHLLRRLSDEFVRGLAAWVPDKGMKAPPRTFSTLQALNALGPLSITELAEAIRQSHPHIITWVRQLKELGLVESSTDPKDGRKTIVSLTPDGEAEVKAQREVIAIVARAYDDLMEEVGANMFEPLWRVEEACRHLSFEQRLRRAEAAVEPEGDLQN